MDRVRRALGDAAAGHKAGNVSGPACDEGKIAPRVAMARANALRPADTRRDETAQEKRRRCCV